MINKRTKNKQAAFYLVALAICIFSFAQTYLKANSQNADSTPLEVKITSKQFAYEPNTVTIHKGQPVKLIFRTADVEHSFTINELNLNIVVKPHQIKTVYFTPDKTGTFRFYCDVYCGSGHKRMSGELVVTE